MSWPIPGAGEIAERYAVGFERAFISDDNGRPYPELPDARSPNTALRVIGVVGEEIATDLYLYQRSLADEMMPDRAQDWLPRHAAEWGVPQLPPLTSLGSLVFGAGSQDVVVPAGTEAYLGTLRWRTSTVATIRAGTLVAVPAEAEAPGTGSDLVAGTVLPLVSPVLGLAAQSATVAADPATGAGFIGGRDAEGVEAWRRRILARIRDRGRSGSLNDYATWALEAGAAYARPLPLWQGAGTVAVAIAMAGPRVPTQAELDRVAAYIDALRPVTAAVSILPAQLLAVAAQLAISPDTMGTRASITLALQAFYAREAAIGATIALSRLDEAISSAAGEYAHRTFSPTGDVVPSRIQLPVLGDISFVAGTVPEPP